MITDPRKAADHTYRIRGAGGQGACMAVQSVLQEHGMCGYTEWASPGWHFLYLTHLEPDQVLRLLGGLSQRFKIIVQNGSSNF